MATSKIPTRRGRVPDLGYAPSAALRRTAATVVVIPDGNRGRALRSVPFLAPPALYPGSLACRTAPSVRTPLRLAGHHSTRGKISHSLPMMSDDRDSLKDGGAPPFSSADRAWRFRSEARRLGKACGRTGRYRLSRYHTNKKHDLQ